MDVLLTLMMTATFATPLSILYHIPVDMTICIISCFLITVVRNIYSIFDHQEKLFVWPVEHNPPMSLALAATGLLNSDTNFLASSRISMMLLSRAKRGAKGKDATKSVTKPNWMTGHRRRQRKVINYSYTFYKIHPADICNSYKYSYKVFLPHERDISHVEIKTFGRSLHESALDKICSVWIKTTFPMSTITCTL